MLTKRDFLMAMVGGSVVSTAHHFANGDKIGATIGVVSLVCLSFLIYNTIDYR